MNYKKHLKNIDKLDKFNFYIENFASNEKLKDCFNKLIFNFFNEYEDLLNSLTPLKSSKVKKDIYNLFNSKISVSDFLNLGYTTEDNKLLDMYSFLYVIDNSGLLIKSIEIDNFKLLEKLLDNKKYFFNKLDLFDLILVCNDFQTSKQTLSCIFKYMSKDTTILDMNTNYFLFRENEEYNAFISLVELRKDVINDGDEFEISKINNTILNIYDVCMDKKILGNNLSKNLNKVIFESALIDVIKEIKPSSSIYSLFNSNKTNEKNLSVFLQKEKDIDKAINLAFEMYFSDKVNFKTDLKLFKNLNLIETVCKKNISDVVLGKDQLDVLSNIYNKDENFVLYNVNLYCNNMNKIKFNGKKLLKKNNDFVMGVDSFNFNYNLLDNLILIDIENKNNRNRSNDMITFF